jgi:hypothetical protein
MRIALGVIADIPAGVGLRRRMLTYADVCRLLVSSSLSLSLSLALSAPLSLALSVSAGNIQGETVPSCLQHAVHEVGCVLLLLLLGWMEGERDRE